MAEFGFHASPEGLSCDGVLLSDIARDVGTPVYVYSARTLVDRYRRLSTAFQAIDPRVLFSVKSCHNLAVLRTLVSHGAGLDVVSGGELVRARLAGCPSHSIAFAGVGKSLEEMRWALDGRAGPLAEEIEQSGGDLGPIGLFDIESEPELERLVEVASQVGVRARAAVRVNPDVQANTHRHTATGSKQTKFGLSVETASSMLEAYKDHEWVRLDGIHCHIGSQIRDPEPFGAAVDVVLGLTDALSARGVDVGLLNLGGGFGIDEGSASSVGIDSFAEAIASRLVERAHAGLDVVLEPGRWIAAPAGVLLTRVEFVKRAAKTFLICDAGMHTFVRPSHYDAQHEIQSVKPRQAPSERYDIVGPVCETGDYLALDRELPETQAGDVLAVSDAGAYGMSMASTYNSHVLPAEVIVADGRWSLIRDRGDIRTMIGSELSLCPDAAPAKPR